MDGRKKRIMIVEDQQVLLDLYREKFTLEGYEVLACTNGLEAVTRLDEFRPDAILLDIMMPQMDGFETLRVIRRLAPTVHTKIVVFSNLSWEEHVERCKSLGADGYIVKADMTPAEVYAEIERLLACGAFSEVHKGDGTHLGDQVICPCCGTKFTPISNV